MIRARFRSRFRARDGGQHGLAVWDVSFESEEHEAMVCFGVSVLVDYSKQRETFCCMMVAIALSHHGHMRPENHNLADLTVVYTQNKRTNERYSTTDGHQQGTHTTLSRYRRYGLTRQRKGPLTGVRMDLGTVPLANSILFAGCSSNNLPGGMIPPSSQPSHQLKHREGGRDAMLDWLSGLHMYED